MAWPIIYYDERPENATVGDMWPIPWMADSGDLLGQHYHKDWAGKRPPLMIALPAKSGSPDWFVDFIVDRTSSKDGPGGPGWKVTIVGELVDGKPANITLAPSVDCGGEYHGYIREGMVTNDCEGRTYKEKDYG